MDTRPERVRGLVLGGSTRGPVIPQRSSTERDVEMQDGTDIDLELTDHEGSEVEQPDKPTVTDRSRRVLDNYLGDLREARALATDPPSLRAVVGMLAQSPQVLADHWLLKFLVRVIYFPIAFPVIFICYFLISSFVHPARGVLVGTLLGAAIWLWFLS